MRRSRVLDLVRSLLCAQLLTIASAQDPAIPTAPSSELPPTAASSVVSATGSSVESATSSASATGKPEPKVHHIAVGNGAFRFDPQELYNVSVGDIVTFDFYPPDHSVARAEFGSACVPYEYTGRNKTGFFSGVYLFDDPLNPIPWNLTINSTEPIFFYCTAPGSCIDKNMVGVINPNDTQTIEEQIKSAKEAEFMLAPGEDIPTEASSSLSGTTAPTSTPSTPSASNTPDSSGDSSKLSGGAIAGIVVGAVAFLALCAALFFFVGRTKSLKEVLERKDATVNRPETGDMTHAMSPGYSAATPFSPHHSVQPSEHGGLPGYTQTNVTDQHPSGWASPDPRHASVLSQPQDAKPQEQVWAAEMPSPDPHQQSFAAELEAPVKSPRQ